MPNLLERAIQQRPSNHDMQPRRVGVEIELAGVEPLAMAKEVSAIFGGEIKWQSPFEITVGGGDVPKFKLELDSQQVKDIGDRSKIAGNPALEPDGFQKTYIETISALAINLVPWEIVTPPLELQQLPKLYSLVDRLQELGAKGTRDAVQFAFGVHLNPELTSLRPGNIVRHLKSFFCLSDWIKTKEKTDLSRRITPYINDFPNDYQQLVLDENYRPDEQQLITDYLMHNPTRNRSLDMLPLFAFLNSGQVEAQIADDRVKARPTFHYRLPNCDIGDPNWNLDSCIHMWMAVEEFANHESLQQICNEYRDGLSNLLPLIAAQWAERISSHLSNVGIIEPTELAQSSDS